ncbi:MAG: hypothetical protein ABH885_07505 [Candidatus Omnitrophota bacterium]
MGLQKPGIMFIPFLFMSAIAFSQIPGDQIDRATRDVARPVREEVEDELWLTTPKSPPHIEEEFDYEENTGEEATYAEGERHRDN